MSLIVGFAVTVAIWPREVVSCCDFILRAVATFWAMSLIGIYLGRASCTPDYCVVYDDCYELVSAVCFGSVYLLSTDHTLVSWF